MADFKKELTENLNREAAGDTGAREERIELVNRHFNEQLNGDDDTQKVKSAMASMNKDVRDVLRAHQDKHGHRPDVPWPIIGYD